MFSSDKRPRSAANTTNDGAGGSMADASQDWRSRLRGLSYEEQLQSLRPGGDLQEIRTPGNDQQKQAPPQAKDGGGGQADPAAVTEAQTLRGDIHQAKTLEVDHRHRALDSIHAYERKNFEEYAGVAWEHPFLGNPSFLSAMASGAVSNVFSSATKTAVERAAQLAASRGSQAAAGSLVASLAAAGSAGGPVGTIAGFLVGVTVSYVIEVLGDNAWEIGSRSVSAYRELVEQLMQPADAKKQEGKDEISAGIAELHSRASELVAAASDGDAQALADLRALSASVEASREEAWNARSAAAGLSSARDLATRMIAIWKRQNVDEPGAMDWLDGDSEMGNPRAGVDTAHWRSVGPGNLHYERDLFTYQCERELGMAGLDIGTTFSDMRGRIRGISSPSDVIDRYGDRMAFDVSDPAQFYRFIRAKTPEFTRDSDVRQRIRDAIDQGASVRVTPELKESRHSVVAEKWTWRITIGSLRAMYDLSRMPRDRDELVGRIASGYSDFGFETAPHK